MNTPRAAPRIPPDLAWYLKRQAKILLYPSVPTYKVKAFGWEDTGVDLSAWQGPVKDADLLASMIDFMIIRAGYGNNYFDPRMDEYRQVAIDKKKRFGLYWFPVPGKDAKKQAFNFYTVWKDAPGEIYPTFDLEVTNGLGKSELDSWWTKLYREFNNYSGLTLETNMTYTSAGFMGNIETGWLKRTELFVASWTTAPQPVMPLEWKNKTWDYWQFTAKGIAKNYGLSSNWVDLDRHNIFTPPGDEDMLAKVIATPHVNVRTGAGTNYPDIGDLTTNSTFKVKNVLKGSQPTCSIWFQIKEGDFADKWVCMYDGVKYLVEITV